MRHNIEAWCQTGMTATMIQVCVVTGARKEASLSCAMALFEFQRVVERTPERTDIELHFVESFDDALNLLWRAPPSVKGAFVVDSSAGFHPDFPLKCARADVPVAVQCHPLPSIDWDRVKARPLPHESPEFWGVRYSVTPVGCMASDGFVVAKEVHDIKALWVSKHAVTDIAARHPEIVAPDRAAFFVPGVFDGRSRKAHERFVALWGRDVRADVSNPATASGPEEFGGCVGLRAALR